MRSIDSLKGHFFECFQPLIGIFKKNPFVFLLGLFVTSRLFLILWGIEGVSHYEELEQGYIAVEFLSGLRGRLIDYQVDSYTGGTLFMGLMAVPFFLLFGPSLFSLKLLALCIGIGSFSLVYGMVDRFLGKQTAVFTCLLWIFYPPILYSTSLMALGSHERRLPLFMMIYCLLMYFKMETTKRKYLILMGISWGFAFSISFINAIAVAACFVALALFSRLPRKIEDWLLLTAAAAAGAGYWIWYNVYQQWGGIQFLAHATVLSDGLSLKEHAVNAGVDLMNLVFHFIPSALSFNGWGPFPGKLLNYAYCAVLVLIVLPDVIATFRLYRRQKLAQVPPSTLHFLKVFFAVYLLLFPAFYCLSVNKIHTVEHDAFNYRYLVPFYSILLLYFSIILAELSHRKKALCFFIFFGIASQIQLVWAQPYGEVFRRPGFKSGLRSYIWRHSAFESFHNLSGFTTIANSLSGYELKKIANQDFFWTLGTNREIADAVLKIESEAFKKYFFLRWPASLPFSYGEEDIRLIHDISAEIPLPYRRYFYIGAAKRLNFSEWTDIRTVHDVIRSSEMPYRTIFYFYWGKSLFNLYRNGYESREAFKEKMDFVSLLPANEKLWIYRGMGYAFYRSFQPGKVFKLNLNLIQGLIPEDTVPELYWGIGWYLGRRYFDFPQKALEKISDFPDEFHPRLLAGYGAFQGENAEMETG